MRNETVSLYLIKKTATNISSFLHHDDLWTLHLQRRMNIVWNHNLIRFHWFRYPMNEDKITFYLIFVVQHGILYEIIALWNPCYILHILTSEMNLIHSAYVFWLYCYRVRSRCIPLIKIIYAHERKPLNFGVNNTSIGFCYFVSAIFVFCV